MSAAIVPRWAIGAVLGLIWLTEVASLAVHCATDLCRVLADAAGTPMFFLFPFVLWLLLFVPTQSYVFYQSVILALCVGLYLLARRVLPPRLTIAHVGAVLLVWVLLSAAGFWFLFQVAPYLRPPAPA